jgi:hypothetical protein
MEIYDDTVAMDNCLNLLNGMSKENKLKVLVMLINEIDKEENVVDRFFGAFKSDKSAEEIIAEIRSSRNFSRIIESF